MIEPLLCGIVLGLIPVTLMGLFVAAWNQYRRGGSALGAEQHHAADAVAALIHHFQSEPGSGFRLERCSHTTRESW